MMLPVVLWLACPGAFLWSCGSPRQFVVIDGVIDGVTA
jgi:hypothetical protein